MNRILLVSLILVCLLAIGLLGWAMTGQRGAELSLTSNPDRASVWMDGQFLGTTPLKKADVAPGKHVLRVARSGHKPAVREVTLAAGANPAVEFRLAEQAGGTLSVVSDPPGAEVSFDGEPVGVTPLTLHSLSAGGHPVRIALVNYFDWAGTAEIQESRTAEIKVTLQGRTEAYYLDEIKRKPKDAAPYTDLGHYYIVSGQWTKAEDAFAQALVLVARDSESNYYASRLQQEVEKVFRSQFNYNDAPRGQMAIVNAYIKACKECPTYTPYYGQALNYAAERNLAEQGQEIIEIGIVSVPYDYSWMTQTIQRRWGDGSADRWIERLTSQLKRDPEDIVARFQRAVLYSQKGDGANAVTDYEEVAKKAKAPAARARLKEMCGRLYERQKDFAKSAEAYSAALKIETVKKNRVPTLYNLARVLTRGERWDPADAAWKDAVTNQEDIETACRWRIEWAQMCVSAGKPDRARELLDETLRLTHDDTVRSRAQGIIGELKPK